MMFNKKMVLICIALLFFIGCKNFESPSQNGDLNKPITNHPIENKIECLYDANQAQLSFELDGKDYMVEIHTYHLLKNDGLYWKKGGGYASNPLKENELIHIYKSDKLHKEGYLALSYCSNIIIPSEIYEYISPLYSYFVWNENVEFILDKEQIIGYQVMNYESEFKYSDTYLKNPELIKDYDLIAITLKIYQKS